MTLGARDGVLLVAHGTVTDLDELPEFLLKIRHGRPSPPELLAELRRRYQAIGGSPLLELTRRQARALASRLNAPVLVGMRLWTPTVEQSLTVALDLRLERMCLIPLAPYSVAVYRAAAEKSWGRLRSEIARDPPALIPVAPWGSEPLLVQAHAENIRTHSEGGFDQQTLLVLTAHSLPLAIVRAGDSYADEVRQSAEAIANALGVTADLAFQSQGADGGEWLGPDLLTVLKRARDTGKKRVVVAPIGFLAEHVETLYDLDIEGRAHAEALGLEFQRIPTLNDGVAFVEALAALVERTMREA